MKLITEQVEEVQFIAEAKENGKKDYFIEGVFLQADLKNRNGRVYPRAVMEKEVNRYMKEYVEASRAFGELGHPSGPTVNLDRASHKIVSLKEDGSNYIGKAKIMDTPMGKIVKVLLDEGAKLGVSSRGVGTVKTNSQGINEVQGDFYLSTAADIVADPSAPDAFVRGIMENVEWVLVDGVWSARDAEAVQEEIKKTPSRNLEEVKLQAFERFLTKIASL
jgi:hypothetical protein